MLSSSSHRRVQLGASVDTQVSEIFVINLSRHSDLRPDSRHHTIAKPITIFHPIQVVPMTLCPNYASFSLSLKHLTSTTQSSLMKLVREPHFVIDCSAL